MEDTRHASPSQITFVSLSIELDDGMPIFSQLLAWILILSPKLAPLPAKVRAGRTR